MNSSRRLKGFHVEVPNGSSSPYSPGQNRVKDSNSGSQFMQNAHTNARTVKVPRNVWTIGQQVYEGNLIEFGIPSEVAALAASYGKYSSNLLSHKGADMILCGFEWKDTEEGESYWKNIYKQAIAIEEMWNLLKKENNDI